MAPFSKMGVLVMAMMFGEGILCRWWFDVSVEVRWDECLRYKQWLLLEEEECIKNYCLEKEIIIGQK